MNRNACVAVAVMCALLSPESAWTGQERTGSASSQPKNGLDENVKVRGDWTIVVRKPDGSVASRHRFDNALTPTGLGLLRSLLQGNTPASAGAWRWWRVFLRTTDPSRTPCADGSGNRFFCVIAETLENNPVSAGSAPLFKTMTMTRAGGKITLRGNAKTTFDGEIGIVSTHVARSDPGSILRFSLFTEHTLSTPIPVSANQTVEVTVEISFS